MLTRMVLIAAAVMISLPSLAQAAKPAVAEKELVGTLTGDKVAVRSSPSTTGAYRCTTLSTGDKVVVLKTQGEWLQIKPVAGTWGVIAKRFVKPNATGKTGTVTGDNVWVRAGGDLCTFENVADHYASQGQLNKGDTVAILGEAGDYYKIVPPEFATFWISAKYVDLAAKPAPAAKPAATKDSGLVYSGPSADKATTKPAVAALLTPKTATTKPAPATATVRESQQATLDKIETVRLEMMAEYKKPVAQRDLRRIIARFNAIDTTGSVQGAKLVAYYTTYMENQLAILDKAKAAAAEIEQEKADITNIQVTINTVVIEEQGNPRPKAYNAQGVIQPSGAFPGTKYAPKRWVVRDPFNNRITAYVQCTTGEVDLAGCVGRHVGIWGEETYNEHLKLYIVEAQDLVMLDDGAKPAARRVNPMGVPVSKPAVKEETPVETADDDEEDDADADDDAIPDEDDEEDEEDDDAQEIIGAVVAPTRK